MNWLVTGEFEDWNSKITKLVITSCCHLGGNSASELSRMATSRRLIDPAPLFKTLSGA
ncbi:hypothetical protein JXJ21_09690 [candidate division KSB1 bacterium]|nr:hypothetical protein [candidate division KSB1 bacterium]